ncbi:Holliday junction branch migration DNA helicase RuvB [Phycisphaeraceae bacterium D3-23]
MATERIISADAASPREEQFNLALRPQSLAEYVGQPALTNKLSITLQAVRQRGEPMEHVLLHGPPGLGKTTLAHIIANEMGTHLTVTAGPALTKPGDLVGLLTKLQPRDVLFIDEIHRLPIALEEYLYSAMEDFKIDVQIDSGMHAKTITLPVQPFSLIGATTRAGLLSGPMRSRFGLNHNLEFYSEADLLSILLRSAGLLGMDSGRGPGAKGPRGQVGEPGMGKTQHSAPGPLSPLAPTLSTIAARSRGTPRIANRLLRRVRDYAQVKHDNQLSPVIVDEALQLEGVDALGLDELDRKYLRCIAEIYEGGPVGLEAVAATLGDDSGTLEQAVEPYLLQLGFLARTRKGRQLTRTGAEHLGVKLRTNEEGDAAGLF